MLKTDLVARNGIFVHVVDRILYSEGFSVPALLKG